MSVSGTCTATFDVRDSQTVGVASITYAPKLTHTVTFSEGSGASKAEDIGSLAVTIGGSPTDVDLAGTSLKDLNGNGIAFTKIKAFMFKAPSTNVGDVTIGADAAAWATFLNATGTITLKPGTSLLVITENANGYAVTATTADILQVDGTSGDVLQISVAGEV